MSKGYGQMIFRPKYRIFGQNPCFWAKFDQFLAIFERFRPKVGISWPLIFFLQLLRVLDHFLSHFSNMDGWIYSTDILNNHLRDELLVSSAASSGHSQGPLDLLATFQCWRICGGQGWI